MRLARIALVLTFLVALAQPVRAGDGYWSPGGCSPPPPVPVEWYGIPGSGAWYRSQYGTFYVGGRFHTFFAMWNHECGSILGIPLSMAYDLSTVSPLYRPGEWILQDFYYGRLMRNALGDWYHVRWADGQVTYLGRY